MSINKVTVAPSAGKSLLSQDMPPEKRAALLNAMKVRVWENYRAYENKICPDRYEDRRKSILPNYTAVEAKFDAITRVDHNITNVLRLSRDAPDKVFLKTYQSLTLATSAGHIISFNSNESNKLKAALLNAVNNALITLNATGSQYVARVSVWRMNDNAAADGGHVCAVRLIPCAEPDRDTSDEWILRNAVDKVRRAPETSDIMVVFSTSQQCDYDAMKVANFLSRIGFENVSLVPASQQQRKGKTGLKQKVEELTANNKKLAAEIANLKSREQHLDRTHSEQVSAMNSETNRLYNSLGAVAKTRDGLTKLITDVEDILAQAGLGDRYKRIAAALKAIDEQLKQLGERKAN